MNCLKLNFISYLRLNIHDFLSMDHHVAQDECRLYNKRKDGYERQHKHLEEV